MPFLASEKILIDPTQGKIILPVNDKEDADDEVFDWDYNPAVLLTVCPKMVTLPK
jgi:hypothetical protein